MPESQNASQGLQLDMPESHKCLMTEIIAELTDRLVHSLTNKGLKQLNAKFKCA